jgi:hypothetical protein
MSIIEAVICAGEGLSPEMIHTKNRHQDIVFCRQLIMYYARKTTHLSFREISKYFNLDHATATFSVNVIHNRLETDKKIRQKMEFYNNAFGLEFKTDLKTSVLQLYGELNNEVEKIEIRILKLHEMIDSMKHQVELIN